MKTFLLAICAGKSPVTGEFPTQRPVTRSFYVFFDLHLNKRLSKQSWGWSFETLLCPLWRHCNDTLIISVHLEVFSLTKIPCTIVQFRLWIIPDAQIPQCTSPISHNAPFYIEICTFLLQIGALWDMGLVPCGICEILINNGMWSLIQGYPDSKVHGANMGPTWVLSAPDGLHVGPINLAIRVASTAKAWVNNCMPQKILGGIIHSSSAVFPCPLLAGMSYTHGFPILTKQPFNNLSELGWY